MIFLGTDVKNGGMPYIVAEISGNHGGKIDRAYKLMDEAKAAGANAVKIQCYDADALTLPTDFEIKGINPWNGKNLYELYMESCTPYDWIPNLFSYANSIGLTIFSSVYDLKGLEALTKVNCRAFKIASYEANDTDFIQKVVATGKPVVLSTGTLNEIEIERSISLLKEDNSIILHCVSKYPCEAYDLSLAEMSILQANYSQPVGFSCHSDDPVSVILAAVQRAAMIEVHFALDDEEGQKASDYEFSFTPEGLKYTIGRVNDSIRALQLKQNQDEGGKTFKRSLYVIKDMMAGETFTRFNVGSYRPYLGCDPYLLPNILGRKANRNIKKHTPMKMEYIK